MNNQTRVGELLIHCLGMGGDFPPEEAGELKQLSSSDWDHISRRLIRYDAGPLLHHRLKGFEAGSGADSEAGSKAGSEAGSKASSGAIIPADAARKLEESYLYSALKNMRIYNDLSNVIRAVQSNGIPVVVLKGAHLAKVVYGNIALRRMCDLDLLFKKADLPKAVKTLLDMGYSPIKPFGIEEECSRRHHLPAFVKKDAVPIEIHWHIELPDTPFSIDIDGLWERARPVTINDVQVLVLSPEDLILHLCLHATAHILDDIGLKPFYDLSEVIRYYQAKDEMDWNLLQLRSKEWRADRPLYLMLSLLKELLGKAMPEDLFSILKSNPVDARFVAVLREYFIMKVTSSSIMTPDLAQFCVAGGLQNKLALFLRKIFPPRHYIAKTYHTRQDSVRVYFYYAVHLKDLLHRYGHVMWQIFRHDKETITLAKVESSQIALRDWLLSL